MRWKTLLWPDLDKETLCEAYVLRQQVFVVEQNCPYVDCDGSDGAAAHLLGWEDDGPLVAYARLFGPGVKYEERCIGRVVTAKEVRRRGTGKELMRRALVETQRLYGAGPVRISAQRYLERFYTDLGFRTVSEPYLEDGIPHVEMLHDR